MPIANFDKVELLLPMTGANNGTVFTDLSLRRRTVTRVGAVTSTAQSKFAAYGSSGLFTTSTQYLTAGVAADWAFLHRGDTTWTIEGWIRPETTGAARAIADTGGIATAYIGFAVALTDAGAISVSIGRGTSGTYAATILSADGVVANTAWAHFRAVSTNGALQAFVNGSSVGTATMSSPSTSSPTTTLNIGRHGAGDSLRYAGHMQDLAIWNGVNRSGEPVPARMTQRTLTRANTGTDSHEYDRAVLFDWNGEGGQGKAVIPDNDGNFEATDLIDLEYGVAFIRDECSPVCRGPVEVDADA
jgi:hypothetical protein